MVNLANAWGHLKLSGNTNIFVSIFFEVLQSSIWQEVAIHFG